MGICVSKDAVVAAPLEEEPENLEKIDLIE